MNRKEEQERAKLIMDFNHAQMKITELQTKIRQQERIIKQLRATLAALGIEEVTEVEIEGYSKPKRGRPQTIDNLTRQRIKELKKNGLSVREIAKKEGVSVGTVSAVINS